MILVTDEFKKMSKGIDRQISIMLKIGENIYDDSEIIELIVENSLSSGENFKLGSLISSKLNFTLRTTNADIPENALVEPFISFKGGLTWNEQDKTWENCDLIWEFDSSEWIPLGKFYIDNRKYTEQKLWKFEAYDKVKMMHQDYFSNLTYPSSMRQVLEEIAFQLSLNIKNIELINPDYQIYLLPTEISLFKAISYIAEANCCNVVIDKYGELKFIKMTPTMFNSPVDNITRRDYFRATKFNEPREFTKIVLLDSDEYTEGEFYNIVRGEGSEYNTLTISNPFINENILDNLYSEFKGFKYIPYMIDYKCFPYLEVGDVVTLEQSEGLSWLETNDIWANANYSWESDIVDYNLVILFDRVEYRGGLRSTIRAESKSIQNSEFKIKSELREYIEKVDKSTLKETVPYNGVTTSRKEGVVVRRTDGKAKTILNATEGISIYSDTGGGLNRNFFVDLNGRIKAKELDIDGSGTFGGTLEANQITTKLGKITTAQIESLEVGKNVIMGPDAIITWNQVLDADSHVTNITYNTVTTSYVNALNVTASELKAVDGNAFFRITSSGLRFDPSFYDERFMISHDGVTGFRIYTDGSTLNFPVGNIVSFEGGVDFLGTVDFTYSTVIGLDTSVDTSRFIETYWGGNNKCYIDYDEEGNRLTVRNRSGGIVGYISL